MIIWWEPVQSAFPFSSVMAHPEEGLFHDRGWGCGTLFHREIRGFRQILQTELFRYAVWERLDDPRSPNELHGWVEIWKPRSTQFWYNTLTASPLASSASLSHRYWRLYKCKWTDSPIEFKVTANQHHKHTHSAIPRQKSSLAQTQICVYDIWVCLKLWQEHSERTGNRMLPYWQIFIMIQWGQIRLISD